MLEDCSGLVSLAAEDEQHSCKALLTYMYISMSWCFYKGNVFLNSFKQNPFKQKRVGSYHDAIPYPLIPTSLLVGAECSILPSSPLERGLLPFKPVGDDQPRFKECSIRKIILAGRWNHKDLAAPAQAGAKSSSCMQKLESSDGAVCEWRGNSD
ncbi:hypothetical protein Anapl_18006 [Anas platyrhynchos]|uniref:Uncharacterized protein n=1 Tax=Anas platyrhynchos TaxID=8839 RepID=R0KRR4_ANAPL|nr:hypothetical protein Anapl_18006 [Anas platyrhynchos]